jgi:hypothetical protein
LHLAKLQLIKAKKALGMTLYLGVSSATFIYIKRKVILMYFIVEERIKAFRTRMEAFNWLKLSEN